MSSDKLIIRGAKQNNLKNVSLELPHNRVIAVTGVSGSGKSSLAFETVFAEGQWRFIESLSTYARLFLEKLDRPDVESIENIRPAIALEQRNPVRGSRSTVGTLTELYDFFRLLFAKVATPHCPTCGEEIRTWEPTSVTQALLEEYEGMRGHIIFRSELTLEQLRQEGYLRVFDGTRAMDIEEAGRMKPPYDVVLDRLVIRDEPRLGDSVESAFERGHGRMSVALVDGPVRSFSRFHACEQCGIELPEPSPLLFSFNHPVGACPQCKGFGNVLRYDESLVIQDPYLTLREGAVDPWEKPAAKWWKKQLLTKAPQAGLNLDIAYRELPAEQRELLFKGTDGFYGVDSFFEELEDKRYKLHVRVFLSRYRKGLSCPHCNGKRLMPEALAYKIDGMDIADFSTLSIERAHALFANIGLTKFQKDLAAEILKQIRMKLDFLMRVGLDYLTLNREGKTLSGGEYQRVNLSNQLASRLTGTLYVLDEPTVGLHRRDTERISEIMAELSEMGNTILVVEHDRGVIEKADWVVELGPGGGHRGGEVVFTGSMDEFEKADTITGQYLKKGFSWPLGRKPLRREPVERLLLSGASGNNLKNVKLEIPLGALSVVSGVSGSGKSTLIVQTLYKALMKELRMGSSETPLPYKTLTGHTGLKGVKLIDQSPIGKSPRSNPVTYLKVFDAIRKLFADQPEARMRSLSSGFFSFNVPGGRCETCSGEGYQKVEMYFFEDLFVTCEDCGGKRYGSEALSVKYMGKSIDEVLAMTVDEAVTLFSASPSIRTKLQLMREVGLGYLRLGQPAPTLSGGEAQRLKLCAELGSVKLTGQMFYVLDEPTVGLHPRDVEALMLVLQRLIEAGNTVVVIEHNLEVIAAADRVIDVGPEGGEGGGKIVFSGTPEGLLRSRTSHTARYLKEIL